MVGRSLARARVDRDLDDPLSSITRLKPGKKHFYTTNARVAKQKCLRSSLVAHWLSVPGEGGSKTSDRLKFFFLFELPSHDCRLPLYWRHW